MYRTQSRIATALVVFSALPLMVFTGCGAGKTFSSPAASAKVTGKVFGGQQPISGSVVTVWSGGTTGYGTRGANLAHTTSDTDGSFSFAEDAYTCAPGELVYITAAGGDAGGGENSNIMLVTGLGDCSAAHTAVVQINEVTTIATAFALAQFFTVTAGSTPDFGTDPADLAAFTNSMRYTIPTLIDIPSGTVQPNTPTITIESAKIYSLANTLAACVNDAAPFNACGTLYNNVQPGAVTDTLRAAVQIARFPYVHINRIYQLASSKPPFTGLASAPNDWTIGISYSSSDYNLSIDGNGGYATSASIDIDVSGKIWFPSSSPFSTGVANFDPVSASFNGPYMTGLFAQPQYVAIDTQGAIFATDVQRPYIGSVPTTAPTGGLNFFHVNYPTAAALGPVAADAAGHVFYTYGPVGNATILASHNNIAGTFSNSNFSYALPPTGIAAFSGFEFASSSGGATTCDDEAIHVVNGGLVDTVFVQTASPCTSGGAAMATQNQDDLTVATSLNQILSKNLNGSVPVNHLNLPEGIATDGKGDEWIANSGNASIMTFGGVGGSYAVTSPVAYVHDATHGGTMTRPYAIAIDGSGNVWTANATCVTVDVNVACNPGPFVLSELVGAAAPTITPLGAQMLNQGSLVGLLPGAAPPVPAVSSKPEGFGSTNTGQSADGDVFQGGSGPLVGAH